jgi:hypothetical protein
MLGLNADIFTKKEYPVQSIKKNDTVTILAQNLIKGQSAFVIHKYDSDHASVLYRAMVKKCKDTRCELKLKAFDTFKQDALPKSNLRVSLEDTVVINALNRSALVIAPDSIVLNHIQKKYEDQVVFIHPDQFGAYLAIEQHPSPSKEDFKQFAKEQAVGLVFFSIENKIYIADADTLAVLRIDQSHKSPKEENVPFYTRVEEIEEAPIDFSSSPVNNYTQYYKKLLGIK